MSTGLKLQPLVIEDMSLGLNQGTAPTLLRPGQMTKLVNLIPWGNKLRLRNGSSFVNQVERDGLVVPGLYDNIATDVQSLANYTNVFCYEEADGTNRVVVGAGPGLLYYDEEDNILKEQSNWDESIINVSKYPWFFRQFNVGLYAMRQGTPMRVGGATGSREARLLTPTAGSATQLAVAGNLIAGTYYYVLQEYDENTGTTSPQSTAFSAVLSGSYQVSISLPQVVNGTTTHWKIFRSLVGSSGEYFRVTTVARSEGAYIDNVAVGDLQERAVLNLTSAPANCVAFEIFQDRMWVTDGELLYPSQKDNMMGFDLSDALTVGEKSGAKIKALYAFRNMLIIGKTNGTFVLTGSDVNSYQIQRISDVGIAAQGSISSTNDSVFWLGTDRNLYQSDGVSVALIDSAAVRTELDDLSLDDMPYLTSVVYPRFALYLLALPDQTTVVYNYESKAFTLFEFRVSSGLNTGAPFNLAERNAYVPSGFGIFYSGPKSNQEQYLYATFKNMGRVFRLLDTGTWKDAREENGTGVAAAGKFFPGIPATGYPYGWPIYWKFRTGVLPLATSGLKAIVQKIGLLCSDVYQTVTLNLYNNQTDTVWKTRSALLNGARWKMFSLFGNAADQIQVEATAPATEEMVIEKLSVEFASSVRASRAR